MYVYMREPIHMNLKEAVRYIYIYMCIYIRVFVFVCMYIYMCMYMCIHEQTKSYECRGGSMMMYIHTCVCLCMYIYIYIYACMYVYMSRPNHMNVEEAVQCSLDLGARRAIAIHWGTWQVCVCGGGFVFVCVS